MENQEHTCKSNMSECHYNDDLKIIYREGKYNTVLKKKPLSQNETMDLILRHRTTTE